MAESQTVVILRNKRDAIAAAIESYERELEKAKADFAHVTATLAIFDAGDRPGSQRPYTHICRGFRYGELAAMCRAALSEGPLDLIGSFCTKRIDRNWLGEELGDAEEEAYA